MLEVQRLLFGKLLSGAKWIHLEDNWPIHMTNSTIELLKQNKVTVLNLPEIRPKHKLIVKLWGNFN